jgi:hypothetical protein
LAHNQFNLGGFVMPFANHVRGDTTTISFDGHSFAFNNIEFSAWDTGDKAGYYFTLCVDDEKQVTFQAVDDLGNTNYYLNFSTKYSQAKIPLDDQKGLELSETLFSIPREKSIPVFDTDGNEIQIQKVDKSKRNVEKY